LLPGNLFFFYLLSAPLKLGLQVALFDVEAGSIVFGGSCVLVRANKQEEKPFWFSLLFYPVLTCYGSKMAAEL